jgi:hypothetical protein
MAFTDLVANNPALRQEAGLIISAIDELQAERKAISDKFSGTNYVPLPGLKVIRKHLVALQEGKTEEPINTPELVILQNELQNIGGFINSTVSFGIMTNDKSQQGLADDYRALSVKYSAMVDRLVDSPTLFTSYQPSPSRGIAS